MASPEFVRSWSRTRAGIVLAGVALAVAGGVVGVGGPVSATMGPASEGLGSGVKCDFTDFTVGVFYKGCFTSTTVTKNLTRGGDSETGRRCVRETFWSIRSRSRTAPTTPPTTSGCTPHPPPELDCREECRYTEIGPGSFYAPYGVLAETMWVTGESRPYPGITSDGFGRLVLTNEMVHQLQPGESVTVGWRTQVPLNVPDQLLVYATTLRFEWTVFGAHLGTYGNHLPALVRADNAPLAITAPTPGGLLDTTPTFTGTGDPNATLQLTITTDGHGSTTCDTTIGADGAWSCTPTTPIPTGTTTVTGKTHHADGWETTTTATYTTATPADVPLAEPTVAASAAVVGVGGVGMVGVVLAVRDRRRRLSAEN